MKAVALDDVLKMLKHHGVHFDYRKDENRILTFDGFAGCTMAVKDV